MTVNKAILEAQYQEFVNFVEEKEQEPFHAFQSSTYLKKNESYKYKVYDEAREKLGFQWWKPELIGTGEIQKKLTLALPIKVYYNEQMVDNNLVDWRQKNSFSKRTGNKLLETTLFNFYKGKIKHKEAFEQLLNGGLTYQFIAYLFFIKDKESFLPISQEKFDQIFIQLGIDGFKTRGNASWENYTEFCDLIKQVRGFLRDKDKNVTLLDAHSFLWILGNQMQEFPVSNTSGNKGKLNGGNTEFTTETPEILPIVSQLIDQSNLLDSGDLEIFYEGDQSTITISVYERNPQARQICIEHWKAICSVCGFDFEKTYGEVGKGFIHVHHLVKISSIGAKYEIDGIRDLRPVCANCHAMLHRKGDITIDELKEKMEVAKLKFQN